MKPASSSGAKDPEFIPKLLRQTLVHQDIITYAQGLRSKVLDVIAAGTAVLDEAYQQFKDFSLNSAALAELQGSSELHEFDYFVATVDAG